ncbi:type II toxin-antitoxin system PemK/MazF family toxin [Sphingomonas prati]|uniref:mRNA interferase MazF n=1 Tax=Sphingomonas prati TaxID=1843237 RepID=A0A7W9BTW4_9SPHN|nr:type II toxin-antitoxin system PemK/MazF family toxin [Sphingomonas prati]MBB5730034.1 mRNA interferase MazF [Sphingomonas prati]GGE90937.1 mRNA interferase PemK [Sphingomonas prati]
MIELRRGQVVLVVEKGDYSGKLRPAVIVQRDSTLDVSDGVTLCGLTSKIAATEPMRVLLTPGNGVGIDAPSMVMADKILTLRRENVRAVVGMVPAPKMQEIEGALRRWLDL